MKTHSILDSARFGVPCKFIGMYVLACTAAPVGFSHKGGIAG